ncbi:hypothetical protein ACFQH6_19405 [Halobacteriaceae archaeon GCM10025711]
MKLNTKILSSLAVLMAVLMVMAPTAAAQNTAMNWGSDNAIHTQLYEERLDVAAHDRAEMSSLTQYYDDSGDVTELPATLNESINNSAAVRADRIEDDDLGIFPRKDNEANNTASATDASEWTTGGANSSKVSVSQADGSTASGVTAIQVATDGTMAAGDEAYGSYSNFSITTDAEKRLPYVIVNVNTLDSATGGTVEFVDADGDKKVAHINSSKTASDADVVANATGSGYLWQERLADLATDGSAGDGTFDGIEEIRVSAVDGDLDVTITGLDAERKSELVLGETLEDTDDDDDLETVTITEVYTAGEVDLNGLSGMDALFSDAVIHDLGVKGVVYDAEDLKSEDVEVTIEEQDQYGSYPQHVEVYYRLEVPAAIDLTHTGLELRQEQSFVDERYATIEYVEGASDTAFSDIDSWTDLSGSLGDVGDTLSLDSTVQAGITYVVHEDILINDDEASDLADTGGAASGGAAGQSGITSWPVIGALFVAILGVLKRFGIV